jgi:hypothetical protein
MSSFCSTICLFTFGVMAVLVPRSGFGENRISVPRSKTVLGDAPRPAKASSVVSTGSQGDYNGRTGTDVLAFAEPSSADSSDRSLFNGSDLSGWEGVGDATESVWKVKDGVLMSLKQRGPWLRSSEQFGDFHLSLEYQVAPGANSGIYVRVPKDGKHHRDVTSDPPAGFEIQLLDDTAAKHRKLKEYQFSGSLYDVAGAKVHVSRPPGEWNTLELDCRANRIRIEHNGVLIVDVDERSRPLLALRQRKGYLGLQNHGGGVNFRNIRIGPSRTQETAAK